jgi:hypothetical protein
MLYREIIAVCFEIHTKHINTLCGQNVELLHVKTVGTIPLGVVNSSKYLGVSSHKTTLRQSRKHSKLRIKHLRHIFSLREMEEAACCCVTFVSTAFGSPKRMQVPPVLPPNLQSRTPATADM